MTTKNEGTQRDELAELIANTKYPNLAPAWRLRGDLNPVKFFSRKQADAILAAGYRKPRTITTAEELDVLPASSVVLDAEELPLERFNNGIRSGWTWGYETVTPQLPVTVLYVPEVEAGA